MIFRWSWGGGGLHSKRNGLIASYAWRIWWYITIHPNHLVEQKTYHTRSGRRPNPFWHPSPLEGPEKNWHSKFPLGHFPPWPCTSTIGSLHVADLQNLGIKGVVGLGLHSSRNIYRYQSASAVVWWECRVTAISGMFQFSRILLKSVICSSRASSHIKPGLFCIETWKAQTYFLCKCLSHIVG